jgi:hypothetical protein
MTGFPLLSTPKRIAEGNSLCLHKLTPVLASEPAQRGVKTKKPMPSAARRLAGLSVVKHPPRESRRLAAVIPRLATMIINQLDIQMLSGFCFVLGYSLFYMNLSTENFQKNLRFTHNQAVAG